MKLTRIPRVPRVHAVLHEAERPGHSRVHQRRTAGNDLDRAATQGRLRRRRRHQHDAEPVRERNRVAWHRRDEVRLGHDGQREQEAGNGLKVRGHFREGLDHEIRPARVEVMERVQGQQLAHAEIDVRPARGQRAEQRRGRG
jgi:hypothetical protein